MNRLNPKKNPSARRKRPVREKSTYKIPEKKELCKECKIKPKRQGSAYCEGCSKRYHANKQKNANN